MKSNRVRRTTSATGITIIEVKKCIGWELKYAYKIKVSRIWINASIGTNKAYCDWVEKTTRKFIKLF